jgi:hypothetical protein
LQEQQRMKCADRLMTTLCANGNEGAMPVRPTSTSTWSDVGSQSKQ